VKSSWSVLKLNTLRATIGPPSLVHSNMTVTSDSEQGIPSQFEVQTKSDQAAASRPAPKLARPERLGPGGVGDGGGGSESTNRASTAAGHRHARAQTRTHKHAHTQTHAHKHRHAHPINHHPAIWSRKSIRAIARRWRPRSNASDSIQCKELRENIPAGFPQVGRGRSLRSLLPALFPH
jgi:hypothetical protein